MLGKMALTLLITLIAIGIYGCYRTGNMDNNWGRSFETARFNQTLNPYGPKVLYRLRVQEPSKLPAL
jgi:hypothetical protein